MTWHRSFVNVFTWCCLDQCVPRNNLSHVLDLNLTQLTFHWIEISSTHLALDLDFVPLTRHLTWTYGLLWDVLRLSLSGDVTSTHLSWTCPRRLKRALFLPTFTPLWVEILKKKKYLMDTSLSTPLVQWLSSIVTLQVLYCVSMWIQLQLRTAVPLGTQWWYKRPECFVVFFFLSACIVRATSEKLVIWYVCS